MYNLKRNFDLLIVVVLMVLVACLPNLNLTDDMNRDWSYAGGFLKSLFTVRNSGHKFWGEFMLFIILVTLLLSKFSRVLCLLACGMFIPACLLTSIKAYRVVVVKAVPSPEYSVDCIWFNALIAVVLGGIFLLKLLRNQDEDLVNRCFDLRV